MKKKTFAKMPVLVFKWAKIYENYKLMYCRIK
jgi:hypothetical protein